MTAKVRLFFYSFLGAATAACGSACGEASLHSANYKPDTTQLLRAQVWDDFTYSKVNLPPYIPLAIGKINGEDIVTDSLGQRQYVYPLLTPSKAPIGRTHWIRRLHENTTWMAFQSRYSYSFRPVFRDLLHPNLPGFFRLLTASKIPGHPSRQTLETPSPGFLFDYSIEFDALDPESEPEAKEALSRDFDSREIEVEFSPVPVRGFRMVSLLMNREALTYNLRQLQSRSCLDSPEKILNILLQLEAHSSAINLPCEREAVALYPWYRLDTRGADWSTDQQSKTFINQQHQLLSSLFSIEDKKSASDEIVIQLHWRDLPQYSTFEVDEVHLPTKVIQVQLPPISMDPPSMAEMAQVFREMQTTRRQYQTLRDESRISPSEGLLWVSAENVGTSE